MISGSVGVGFEEIGSSIVFLFTLIVASGFSPGRWRLSDLELDPISGRCEASECQG